MILRFFVLLLIDVFIAISFTQNWMLPSVDFRLYTVQPSVDYLFYVFDLLILPYFEIMIFNSKPNITLSVLSLYA